MTTGTLEDGTWAVDLDCDGWTSSDRSRPVRIGWNTWTVRGWTSLQSFPCGRVRARLYCFQEAPIVSSLPGFETPGALAFVTSARGFGNLGAWTEANGAQGVAAGDQICKTLARDAGLSQPDSYLAWLSTTSMDARDRFTFSGPWKRLDGVQIASDLEDLTTPPLFTSISVTEKGDYVSGWVLTGTLKDGRVNNDTTCDDWQTDNANGRLGRSGVATKHWTDQGNHSCGESPNSLYCFSQVSDAQVLFADGFESGDTSAWSSTVE